jgi:anti-sigma B factor antagonist
MAFASLPPGDPYGVTVNVEHYGSAVVLLVAGELDLLTTPTLSDACTVALAGRPPVLVIDLSGVTFLASVGMSAIVAAHQTAGAHTKVRVVGGSRDTLRPIMVTGLDTLLSVYPALSAALEDV